jgi:thymidylate synthase (FAD)
MKLLDQTAKVCDVHMVEDSAVSLISAAASTCFGTKPNDMYEHIKRLYSKGHLSPFEHVCITVELLTDIATYKALTRHRHCAFTIESTHYKPYKSGLNIIRVPDMTDLEMQVVFGVIEDEHEHVLNLHGKLAARNVLPQAQAAEVYMTTNLRQWFQIFDLRKGKENTPNMWRLMELIMADFSRVYPFFMELYEHKEA